MGQGDRHGYPSLRQKGRKRLFQLQQIDNDQSRVCSPRGVEGWLERESKMLLKCGTIAYRTTDMRGLISVAHTPWTSALTQVKIRPRSAPLRVDMVAGEGIKNAFEMRDDHLSDCIHARAILCCSDTSDLFSLQGDDPSWVCPPTGGEGVPHAVETRHNCRGRKTCVDCSLLLRRLGLLPSSRCPSQLPNSPSILSQQIQKMGKTRMIMDDTIKSRKGTSWSSRLDKRKNK